MQRAGFLNRIVHVSCARRTKEETASVVFIIQLLLTYLFIYFFSTRTDPLITTCTELRCAAHFSYSTGDRQCENKKPRRHLLLSFPGLCVADRQQGMDRSAKLSPSRPAKRSEICFALRRVPSAHLTEGHPRAGVSSPPFLLLTLFHGRRRIVFTTGEVGQTSRRSINRTCEFKGRRQAAACLKWVE